MIEPTDEMKQAFRVAQNRRAAEIVAQGALLGAHRDLLDCGLVAVFAIVERDYCVSLRPPWAKLGRPDGRGGKHPHFCVRCSDGDLPGPGCGDCRATGMDQTPWPHCRDCKQ